MSRVLCQTIEPEEKRKIIGDTFMKIVDLEAKSLGLSVDDCFLAQGQLRAAIAVAKTTAQGVSLSEGSLTMKCLRFSDYKRQVLVSHVCHNLCEKQYYWRKDHTLYHKS